MLAFHTCMFDHPLCRPLRSSSKIEFKKTSENFKDGRDGKTELKGQGDLNAFFKDLTSKKLKVKRWGIELLFLSQLSCLYWQDSQTITLTLTLTLSLSLLHPLALCNSLSIVFRNPYSLSLSLNKLI